MRKEKMKQLSLRNITDTMGTDLDNLLARFIFGWQKINDKYFDKKNGEYYKVDGLTAWKGTIWRKDKIWSPSMFKEHMWEVIDRMQEDGFRPCINFIEKDNRWHAAFAPKYLTQHANHITDNIVNLAVGKAALLARFNQLVLSDHGLNISNKNVLVINSNKEIVTA